MTSTAPDASQAGLTDDAILRGRLRLLQPARGYRFNLDALLLAHFAAAVVPQPPTLVIDLGAGCGVVGLLLARRWVRSRSRLVERQPALARLAAKNAARNGLAGRVRVLLGDLRDSGQWRPRATAARVLAVCNPPFFRLNSGRFSPDPMVAGAKHELTCTLAELLQASADGLRPGDTLALIHLATRQDELLRALPEHRLQPLRSRIVLPAPGRSATRVLVLARRRADSSADERRASTHAGPRRIEDPPLVVHCAPGVYSAELRQLLGDEHTVPLGPRRARRL
ncbi:MAG: methyltransferase [Proteobacteria bacterium]|nr:methyltransferase [Pseudomonadota bacterium]